MLVIHKTAAGTELREHLVNVAPDVNCTACNGKMYIENKDGAPTYGSQLLRYTVKPAEGKTKEIPGLYCSHKCATEQA